ncbi:MAG: lamin tail domain-containing protein [Phycisphaerae bacterium]|nr:lamin tail domain-containing protein [Phycisphaerae bacterium]
MFDFRKALLFASAAALVVCASAQAGFMVGDFNGDRKVNLADLSLLALEWLSEPPLCTETALAGHWKLDEAEDVIAADASGHGRTGEVEGEAIWRPGGGYLNGAMEFDGVDDVVRMTGYQGITGRDPRTCSAWIRTYRTNAEILTWGAGGAGRRWVLCIQGDGLLRLDVGTGYVDGSTYVNDGAWHHVAAAFDGTGTDDVRLFVDGVLEVVSARTAQDISTSAGDDVCVGVFGASGRYFRGTIDEVRIYERALTMEEVWALARTDTADVRCVDVRAGDGVNLEDFSRMAANWLREKSPVVINEFMADNERTLATTVAGEEVFADWIELYNASSLPVDLAGWHLTDNENNLTKWTFPAGVVLAPGAYLVVFASGKTEAANPGNYPYVDDEGALHTNFSLSKDGEYLGLIYPDGETAAHEYTIYEFSPQRFGFGPQEEDISFGMFYDEMRYFAIPTPGAPNNGAFMGYVGDTKFSHDRGFYDGSFSLRIRCKTPGAVIRYTTDGSTPTDRYGRRYIGPIVIDRTTTLRARASKPGWSPGNVDTQTYLFIHDVIRQSPDGEPPSAQWPNGSVNGQQINYGMDPEVVDSEEYSGRIEGSLTAIPSISIVTDLGNLFNSGSGIYVNALRDGRDWERPASVEMLNPGGGEGFHINAGLRLRGGYSRSSDNPKHAFRLFFRGEYGKSVLDFPLFGDEGVSRFQKVDLRTAQNYSWSYGGDRHNSLVREVFSRDMQRDMGQPYTRSRYYHLYLDGHYWGLFQSQERSEARYAASYMGGEVEDYDVVKVDAGPGRPYTIEATDGTLDAYRRLWEAAAAGFGTNEAYFGVQGLDPNGVPDDALERLVDVDNLIDYMISTFYVGDCDSPISWFLGNGRPNNYYGIYNRTAPDGFKFFRHDAEHSLFLMDRNRDRTGPYPAGSNFVYFNPQWLHQRLAGHPEYRVRFGDRVHNYFYDNGLLTPGQAAASLMSRAGEIDEAIIAESARWGDSKREEPFTRADWVAEINSIINGYFPSRTGVVLGQFRAKQWYPSVTAPRYAVNGVYRHGGHISKDDQISMSAPEGRMFFTLDGADPRLPENALHMATAAMFDANAFKRVHVPTGPDDGFNNAPRPDVGHWKFNDNYADSAERPGEDPPVTHDGTPYGNVFLVPNRNEIDNSAVRFDGKDDFVYVPGDDVPVFDIRNDITLACWVRYSVHHPQAGIVTRGTSSWMLSQAAAEGKLRFSLAGIGNLISDDTWNDDEWHHVAAVRRYNKMILYVDGEVNGMLDVEGDLEIPTATSWRVMIGNNHELWYDEKNDVIRDIDSFEGEIDDVRIYSRALWPYEIERVMVEGEFWAKPDYDDTGPEWRTGTGGAGYEIGTADFAEYIGIDVEDGMYDANSTCCIRIPFEVSPTLGEVLGMTLRIRYDDGFVAYLNGYEVARSNVWGQPGWDSTATVDRPNADAAQVSEFDLTRYRSLLRPGAENVFGILGVNFDAASPDYLTWAELVVHENVVVSDTATLYSEPFTLDKSRIVKARTLSKAGQWSALTEAPYAVGPVAEGLQVTEIMYHPADADDAESNTEFIEVRNVGDEMINLNLVRFTEGIHFTFGDVQLERGDYAVVVASRADFEKAYPAFAGLIAGEYTGRLDNAGEKIRLADAFGRTICEFSYDDDWYDITDGDGFSLTLRSAAQQRIQDLDARTAAHWRLDERSSDVAPDASGNGHTALLFGEPVWRHGKGRIDGAMLFDGVEDYIQAAEYAGIGGSADRTCAAWICTRAGGAIVAWGQSGSGKWAVVVNEDGLLQVDAGSGHVTGSKVVNDGQWRHIAVVSDTGAVRDIVLYVDGRPDPPSAVNSGSISTSAGGLVTIGTFDEDGPFFAGLIDDVRIYSESLDSASVEALYTRGKYPGSKSCWRPSARVGGSPGFDDTGAVPGPGAVKINEILAHSHGAAADWIELRNVTDSTISIGGWFLSDSRDNYRKFEIPAGTTLSPGGYAVFYEDQHFGNRNHAGCHVPFALSENGETLYLRSGADADGALTGYYEEERFDASETGVAFGRYLKSTGTYNFVAMSENTPGAANAYPKVGPVVISEIMYNPASGGTWDHNEYEYLELLNISDSPVALQEFDGKANAWVPWRFTDGIDYEFPMGTVIGAGQRLVVVKNPAAFLERYGELDAPALGPYDGRLDNSGEQVTLAKPGDAESGRQYYIRVDRVVYENTWPWPAEAAAAGKALERIAPAEYGNDVVNWRAADPTPGE